MKFVFLIITVVFSIKHYNSYGGLLDPETFVKLVRVKSVEKKTYFQVEDIKNDEFVFQLRAKQLKADMDNCMRLNPQYPGNILCMESIYNYEMFTDVMGYWIN